MSRRVLHIDWTACDGRGLCSELLPELIARDPWGYPIAEGRGSDIPIPITLDEAAEQAVGVCPKLALSLRGGIAR
jgi:ferredoxin